MNTWIRFMCGFNIALGIYVIADGAEPIAKAMEIHAQNVEWTREIAQYVTPPLACLLLLAALGVVVWWEFWERVAKRMGARFRRSPA